LLAGDEVLRREVERLFAQLQSALPPGFSVNVHGGSVDQIVQSATSQAISTSVRAINERGDARGCARRPGERRADRPASRATVNLAVGELDVAGLRRLFDAQPVAFDQLFELVTEPDAVLRRGSASRRG
jgi:hypothetical protein